MSDDNVTKPFHTEELVLRLRALIRRSAGHGSPILSCGALSLDANAARFSLDGQPVALTAQEHRILAYLDDGPGIAEDQLPRVIERGVRLDQRAPGNGLGLSIVSTLAASYDGELVLQQTAPTGLRATPSLPGSIAH